MVAYKWRQVSSLVSMPFIAVIVPAPLHGQVAPSLEGDNLVLSRPRPGLDPTGFDFAGVTVFPGIDGSVGYDDNIYLDRSNKVSSGLLTIRPYLVASSDWSRDSLKMTATSTIERYTSKNSEDYETYDIDASGRIDLLESVHFDGSGHYRRSIEARGSAGDLFTGGKPIHFYDRGGSGSATVSLSKLDVTVGGDLSRITYANARVGGETFSQGYRNRNYYAGTAKLSYSLSPAFQPFVQISRENEHYDLRQKQTSLDSTGTVALAGVNISLTKLLTGRVGFGYRWRGYRNPNYANSNGLTYDLALVWNPRTLVSVTIEAQKTIEESPQTGASGIIDNEVSARLDYEILRRLVLSGTVTGSVENYRGMSRTDHRVSSLASIGYLMNRFIRLDINYDHEFQHGDGVFGRSYRGNRVGLTISIQH